MPEKLRAKLDEVNCVTLAYSASKVVVPFRALLQGLELERIREAHEDSAFLEELNYRARIFIVTNFPELFVKEFLIRNNLDAFVQGVISSERIGALKPSREFFERAVKLANANPKAITLVSSSPADIMVAKQLGMKAFWINRGNKTFPFPQGLQPDQVITTLKKVAEVTAGHKVDATMGDSALRCT